MEMYQVILLAIPLWAIAFRLDEISKQLRNK
jgi:hypothetical protein